MEALASELIMATLVIKNFPDDLHARLKEQAQRHRRSLTKEAVTLLESGLAQRAVKRPAPRPLKLRTGYRSTIADIEAAIAEGQD
jgi:plasmid stability protein